MNSGYNMNNSLLHLIHRAAQVVDEAFALEVAAADLDGLTHRQFVVMAAIGTDKMTSQTVITQLTGIDRSTLTGVIVRLQKRGLLQRRRSRVDSRSFEVTLTASGRKVLASAMQLASRVDKRMLELMASGKQGEFLKSLRLVSDEAGSSLLQGA